MFRARRRARAAREAMRPLIENEQAVRGAEEVVRRAWARELLRRREHAEFDVRAAGADEDAARSRLVSAQRDGEPWKIAAARAALERAVEAAQASVRARDRMRRTLSEEWELMEQETRDQALSRLVRQMGHERPAIAARGLGAAGDRAAPRSRLRIPRTLRRVAVRRSVKLERP